MKKFCTQIILNKSYKENVKTHLEGKFAECQNVVIRIFLHEWNKDFSLIQVRHTKICTKYTTNLCGITIKFCGICYFIFDGVATVVHT